MTNIFATPPLQVNNVPPISIDNIVNSDVLKNLQLTYGLDSALFNNLLRDLLAYLSTTDTLNRNSLVFEGDTSSTRQSRFAQTKKLSNPEVNINNPVEFFLSDNNTLLSIMALNTYKYNAIDNDSYKTLFQDLITSNQLGDFQTFENAYKNIQTLSATSSSQNSLQGSLVNSDNTQLQKEVLPYIEVIKNSDNDNLNQSIQYRKNEIDTPVNKQNEVYPYIKNEIDTTIMSKSLFTSIEQVASSEQEFITNKK
ncbi:MAG: hypothetical protein ACK4NF_06750, partial [Planctomycetota bacterium]